MNGAVFGEQSNLALMVAIETKIARSESSDRKRNILPFDERGLRVPCTQRLDVTSRRRLEATSMNNYHLIGGSSGEIGDAIPIQLIKREAVYLAGHRKAFGFTCQIFFIVVNG